MSIGERVSSGMKGLAKIAVGGVISILPLVNEGCTANEWYNMTHCEPIQPQRQRVLVRVPALPQFFISTGWEDGSDGSVPNGVIEPSEIKGMNTPYLKGGDIVYGNIFNFGNLPARGEMMVLRRDTGEVVYRSGEQVILPCSIGRFSVHVQQKIGGNPAQFYISGILNGVVAGRKEVTVSEYE